MATKFIRCCYNDCNKDAIVEYTSGTVVIPVCEDPIHIAIGPLFSRNLAQGKDSKYLNKKRLIHKKTGKTVNKPLPRSQPKKVTASWRWIDDFDCWMNAEGQTVLLASLDDDELIDSMHAIRQANFTRYSKTIAWLKDLYINNPPKYIYPDTELQVGRSEALTKLEQFREEAVERVMLNW
jgi:hypothetical protein